jgi:phospholipid/cholesterol/gamma-HCH transport system permease protein
MFAWINRWVNRISDPVLNAIEEIGHISIFFGDLIKLTYRLMLEPKRFKQYYYRLTLDQMVRVGVDSIPIVLTTALFTGMVLALQTGVTIEQKIQGSSVFIGNIVNLALVRELGPVLTAILVTGRVGSAMAAEIGSMKITEQLDALKTLATNPLEYIGVPRFLATTVMIPLLTVMSNVMGSLGGWFVASFTLGLSSNVYWKGAMNSVDTPDVMTGLAKSVFFAMTLCLFALYRGFTTRGGAEGVGRSTTGAVVNASITILISDYFLTQFFALF